MAYAIETSDRRRRRALRAATPIAALLIAALLVWQGRNAAFSATTVNNNDAWATGNLALTNNGGGTTYAQTTTTGLFGESNLKPTSTGTKCITVNSSGSLPGALKLWRGGITGTNGALLAAEINLVITAGEVGSGVNVAANCTNFPGSPTAVYTGTLADMPQNYAAASISMPLDGGAERVAYRIQWTIDPDATVAVQSSNAVTSLTWEVN